MKPNDSLWPWFAAFVVWYVLFALFVASVRAEGAECNPVALAKARAIVRECYPNSGFYPYIGTLLRSHATYAAAMGASGKGFEAAWWYSLVYGGANFRLKVGGIAPENCAGPLDVKAWPLVLDPIENIDHHVGEMATGWQKGYRGRRLCEYVMLPSSPRDWGGGKFRKTDAKHRAVIAKAYREGRL